MTADARRQCPVCAWREACTKKHSLEGSSLHCPDFSRDLGLPEAPEEPVRRERHKRTEDVFGR